MLAGARTPAREAACGGDGGRRVAPARRADRRCGGSQEAVDGTAAYKAKDYHARGDAVRAGGSAGDKTPGALYNYGTALVAADSLPAAARDPRSRGRAAPIPRCGIAPGSTPGSRISCAGSSRAAEGRIRRGNELELRRARELQAVLIQRPTDLDAKWNYELALEKQKQGGGGAVAAASRTRRSRRRSNEPKPQPTLAQRQAEQLLGSAEREERDVQSKKQKQNRPEPPPGGKDW